MDRHRRRRPEPGRVGAGVRPDRAQRRTPRRRRPHRPGGRRMSSSTLSQPEATRESPRDAAGTMRDRFYEIAPSLLDDEPRAALVLAVIGAGYLDPRERRRLRERIVDVGIREQLLLGVAGGLALTGVRP